MSIKRILAFTGIRSDYDLMSGLYKKLNDQKDIELSLVVSGAHLSETYGYTLNNILEDKIPILATIESLIDSNSKSSRIKSMSILLQNCIHTVERYSPDLIIYPGDREDVMVGALIGAYLNIPTAHFFGGDHASDGNVDNAIRHAASKLSSLHFVTNEESAKRLIHLGESPDRIFNVGNPSLDKFIDTPHMEKKELLKTMDREDWKEYAILIFHPILGEEEKAGAYFKEIIHSLKEKNINTFISYPNVDSGNKQIIGILDDIQKTDSKNFCIYKNLPRDIFINLLRNAEFLIGNSSAGLYEAPTIPLGVVNVGRRQKGRFAAENVIFVNQGLESIQQGLEVVTSKNFNEKLPFVKSPFGNGNSVGKIISILNELNLNNYKFKMDDPLGVK